ncbi:MAG TPA: tyrosinase family protein [Thermoanaerobaculia bacterium]|jgi:hypothetical protein|nr:tyrosinase family protein [Thermoanaerobaculia bacterium]
MVVGFVGSLAAPGAAAPVPCAGGTLDFTTVSDTPFTLPTFNVGQKTTLTAVTTGFTATSFSWTIPGPHIKDYNDDLGTQLTVPPATPLTWSTTPLAAADLAATPVSFYWKPSAAQIHPLNGGPEARVVSLTVTPSGGGSCTSSATFMIERNMTNSDKQPEDFYTSTHRALTETNVGFGHVVDEHIYWHQFVGSGPVGNWRQFLAWHGYFLRRFDQWRAEFGYSAVTPWYPGRPLPTGPAFDHPASLRLAFNPDSNRIPTYYTIAGGTAADFGGQTKLADYPTVDAFSGSFEGSYHGQVHCNIGPATGGFFDTSGPGFGSMCRASSPKDPMFWRWHGLIDTMYRNHCKLRGITCHSGPDATSDPWMGDNDPDIAANGNVPSLSPRWLSPDIWNRRTEVTTDACIPRDPPPNLNTVGGVTRECGSSAEHENPVAGVTNYLYATLRNTRPGPTRNVYAEVAVYIANASTGLAWPADFTLLPQSRQFITLHLEPAQVTDIGPLPWTPPSPAPADHWCLYIRVLSVQEAPLVEGLSVDTNVANSNSIAWRNLKIVEPGGDAADSAMFLVRNIREGEERLELQLEVAPALLRTGRLVFRLDETLRRAFTTGQGKVEGLRMTEPGVFTVTSAKSRIAGIRLAARRQGAATVRLYGSDRTGEGDVQVTQISSKGVDGGVTLRVAKKARRPTRPNRPT